MSLFLRQIEAFFARLPGMADISEQSADILFLGIDHGINSVRDGGPLTPFVIIERAGERTLIRFHADTLEDSVAQAVARITAEPIAQGDRSLLVYDGYLTTQDAGRLDAIYAEALEADGTVAILAQRYKPKAILGKFQTIGNPALVPGKGKL